jgi:hypothetical protein
VTVSDKSFLSDLAEDLRQRADTLVTVTGPRALSVSLLGSYNAEAMRAVIEARLRVWEAAQQARGRRVRAGLRLDDGTRRLQLVRN